MIHTFVAMLLFAFFAITGLIVDVGFARLTQRQMSQAAEAAALEGVRLRDTVGTTIDDAGRRDAVRTVLEYHFDDDFLATAEDSRNYGAGPLVTLGPGMTSIGANRKVEVDPDQPVYKPTPQLNLDNARHGDLVHGGFDASDLQHRENSQYIRTDFDENAVGTADDSTLDAFLVRLRRTRNENGLDQQPGVSSRGPALPFLFGQGSMIAPETRERGMTVRATAIAGARRATLVGLPDPSAGLPGVTPFLLDYDYWNTLAAGQAVRLRFDGNGQIIGSGGNTGSTSGPPQPNPFFPYDDRGGPPIIPPGQINAGVEPIGMLADRLALDRRAWSIGDDAVPMTHLTLDDIMAWLGNPDADGYVPGAVYFFVPIYEGTVQWDGRPGRQPGEAFKEGDPRVVGFGAVAIVDAARTGFPGSSNNGNNGNNGNGNGNGNSGDDDDDGGSGPEIEIVKLPTYVAPFNASAVETPGLAGAFAATIMERYKTVSEPLRAAALVR